MLRRTDACRFARKPVLLGVIKGGHADDEVDEGRDAVRALLEALEWRVGT